MKKAVVDTNVFVSGVIKEESPSGNLIKLWKESRFILVTSPEIIGEIVKVLDYPKIRKKYHVGKNQVKALLDRIYLKSEIVEGTYSLEKLKDATDNMFLACAYEGNADYVVSGDKELLRLKHFYGIQIVGVTGFLKCF